MNTLFLVSGPSGSGKTTIMRQLMDNEVVSFTTRAARPGEVDGFDYLFITEEEFQRLSRTDGLVEQTEYAGNHYGITMREFVGKLRANHAFAIVDAVGMRTLKKLYPKSVTIFIYADEDDARLNLAARGESQEFIDKRLRTYHDELNNRRMYDYAIRNNRGRLEDAIAVVSAVMASEVSK